MNRSQSFSVIQAHQLSRWVVEATPRWGDNLVACVASLGDVTYSQHHHGQASPSLFTPPWPKTAIIFGWRECIANPSIDGLGRRKKKSDKENWGLLNIQYRALASLVFVSLGRGIGEGIKEMRIMIHKKRLMCGNSNGKENDDRLWKGRNKKEESRLLCRYTALPSTSSTSRKWRGMLRWW